MTTRSAKSRFLAGKLAIATISLLAIVSRPAAQGAGPREIAAKLTGSWALNQELTPTSSKPGHGRGFAGGAAAAGPLAALMTPMQRGGRGGDRGGGGGNEASAPLPAAEVAAQAALSILHEVPMTLRIEASADAVTFRDPRGEWHFMVDDRNHTMEVPGGTLRTRSKWERGALRQEFSSAQRALVKTWNIDANDRLVLIEKIESMTVRSESKAVFDRQ